MTEITTRDWLIMDTVVYGGKYNDLVFGFTSGVFDLLHAGHVDFLEKCKAMCDVLIVGVNTDESAEKIKRRPINCLEHRMKVLSGLASVDYIFPFDEINNRANVDKLKPDIYFKAGDYDINNLTSKTIVEQHGGRVVIVPVEYRVSTTEIINKCVVQYGDVTVPHKYLSARIET